MGHLGNISYRMGAATSPEELKASVADNAALLDAYERYSKHLADWNIDLKANPWTMGPTLEYDNYKERFGGANAKTANSLLHRKDRAPFIVPKHV